LTKIIRECPRQHGDLELVDFGDRPPRPYECDFDLTISSFSFQEIQSFADIRESFRIHFDDFEWVVLVAVPWLAVANDLFDPDLCRGVERD